MRKHILVHLLLFACAVAALASDALLERLEPNGYVNDFAHILSADDERRINGVITELNRKTGAQIAVVTIQSLEGGNIDDFTNRLFEKWGVGQEGKDNGLMFLCAMQDRKMRIEVGYGLEGVITDSKAGVIRRNIITPHFKAGNPAVGVLAGVEALSAAVQGKTIHVPVMYKSKKSNSGWIMVLFFLLPVVFIGYLIFVGIKQGVQPDRRGRRYWDGSYGHGSSSGSHRWDGGGGGFGGFGGGGFSGGGGFGGGCSGGGGSSGGW